MSSSLHSHVAALYSVSPVVASIAASIVYLPITIRKVLLTATRIQPPHLHSSSKFAKRFADELDYMVPIHSTMKSGVVKLLALRAFIEILLPYIQDPVGAGFISTLLRYLPYDDYTSVEETRDNAISKELSAAVSVYHPATFQYLCLFSAEPRHRSLPFAENVNQAPTIASSIRQSLTHALFLISRTEIFVPKLSSKTIKEFHTSHAPFEFYLRSPRPIRTLEDVEEIYCRTGMRLAGATEVRAAWKPNNLAPRIYYARGPDVHFASSIIQAIFNLFVDSLWSTHRKDRFNIYGMDILPDEFILFIYDYASFTSKLREIRHFTGELADWCTGIEVQVLDGYMGPIYMDVGKILREYNEVCNIDPDFDASELLSVHEAVLSHNTGMLGVPGNISSCTLLHGIHLAMVLGRIQRGKVVGDDAIGEFDPTLVSKEELLDALRNIGEISEAKMEFWEFEDELDDGAVWNYVKRPLARFEGRPLLGQLVTWPGFNVLLDIINPFHVPLRYDAGGCFRTACKQLLRFRRDLLSMTWDKELLLPLVRNILIQFSRNYGLFEMKYSLGYIGDMTVKGIDVRNVIVPPLGAAFFTWTDREFFDFHGDVLVKVPHWDQGYFYTEFSIGGEFIARTNPVLSYLRKLSFLEAERSDVEARVSDLDSETLELLVTGSLRYKYKYTVVDDLPEWAIIYMKGLFHIDDDSE
ncbi:TPA_asm: hypothetical protein [Armillaria mellea ambi-like virus 1]|uniref:Uncharacterized protein n=1 Tax=Armillaria mellea ambi-like virus 1 TaxID=2803968 RepID=A0A8D9UGM3_9VIRU|nr:TPA_asm: hypothetical protein [Armillaria mellea ambi-like virus 1]